MPWKALKSTLQIPCRGVISHRPVTRDRSLAVASVGKDPLQSPEKSIGAWLGLWPSRFSTPPAAAATAMDAHGGRPSALGRFATMTSDLARACTLVVFGFLTCHHEQKPDLAHGPGAGRCIFLGLGVAVPKSEKSCPVSRCTARWGDAFSFSSPSMGRMDK